jgi:DedD protein
MDPALRQRLIGAAVLILLAVIFVPMLLDGPPPEIDTREVSLEIPAQPVETRRLPVEPVPVSSALGEREEPAATDAERAPSAGSAVVQTPPGVSSEPPPAVIAAPAPAPAPAPAAETPAATSSATGRYVVRFGSFGDQANADRLVRRLKEKGVEASVEPVKAGERTLQRVVSQPVADRAAAEQ